MHLWEVETFRFLPKKSMLDHTFIFDQYEICGYNLKSASLREYYLVMIMAFMWDYHLNQEYSFHRVL